MKIRKELYSRILEPSFFFIMIVKVEERYCVSEKRARHSLILSSLSVCYRAIQHCPSGPRLQTSQLLKGCFSMCPLSVSSCERTSNRAKVSRSECEWEWQGLIWSQALHFAVCFMQSPDWWLKSAVDVHPRPVWDSCRVFLTHLQTCR